jgi:hypothetical protein
MTNGKHVYCVFDGCNKFAGYNVVGLKTPLYCTSHKEENMIDLKHHLCLEKDCDKRPVFNNKGSKIGLYCFAHKKEGMVNLFAKKCLSDWCDTSVYARNKYENYCIPCYIQLFPDKPTTRNYKTKEKAVADFVLSSFSSFTWITDRRIHDGCSKRRPDLLLDLGSHVVIVEVDENQHIEYDCSCENKRIMEISRDIGHRPLVFIRFNPDVYFDNKNNKITSCWKPNKQNGVLCIPTNKQGEWNNRLSILKKQIEYWIENKTYKTVEIIQLYYDGMLST